MLPRLELPGKPPRFSFFDLPPLERRPVGAPPELLMPKSGGLQHSSGTFSGQGATVAVGLPPGSGAAVT